MIDPFVIMFAAMVLQAAGLGAFIGWLVRQQEHERATWHAERTDLLNRIQAKDLAEYRHLTATPSKPRVANPMRRAFAPPDLVEEPRNID